VGLFISSHHWGWGPGPAKVERESRGSTPKVYRNSETGEGRGRCPRFWQKKERRGGNVVSACLRKENTKGGEKDHQTPLLAQRPAVTAYTQAEGKTGRAQKYNRRRMAARRTLTAIKKTKRGDQDYYREAAIELVRDPYSNKRLSTKTKCNIYMNVSLKSF